jgi:cupin domain
MVAGCNDYESEIRENMRGGSGCVELLKCRAEIPNCRMSARITLKKGCSIGRHQHIKESEIFYVLSGKGIYDDNGTEVEISASQTAVCLPGQYHSVENREEQNLVLLAHIVLE